VLLERMCERHDLHHRVELLGTVAHSDVRDVLVRGHLFLNCSHTESFCMALLEAASCGLFIVSTAVGGIPEVLPPDPDIISLARPDTQDLIRALGDAIKKCGATASEEHRIQHSSGRKGRRSCRSRGNSAAASASLQAARAAVCARYSWPDVAQRTEAVYRAVLAAPRNRDLASRLERYARVSGLMAKLLGCLWALALHALWKVCELLWPIDAIEKCPKVPWGGAS
jgi:phosphatidylinositol glycan class A protein